MRVHNRFADDVDSILDAQQQQQQTNDDNSVSANSNSNNSSSTNTRNERGKAMGDKPKVIDAANGITGYTRSRRSSVIAALRSRAEKEHRRSRPGTGNGAGTRYVQLYYTILCYYVYVCTVCMHAVIAYSHDCYCYS
jgi:hypothetical protein